MTSRNNQFPVRLSVLAVQSALVAMAMVSAAHAQGIPTVEELTKPSSTVEIGVTYTKPSNSENRNANGLVNNTNGNDTSFKFGEYNGLYKKGATAIGNFDIRGGGAYDSTDPTRWRVRGTDLGLETRNLQGEYGQQGRFRLSIGYDELLRNRSDTYMTPYLGAGSNTLTLPSNWIKPIVPQASGTATTNTSTGQNFRALDPVNGTAPGLASGVVVPATAATLATLANIRTVDLADFHNVDLSTKRKKTDLGFSYEIDGRWGVSASARHETKEGLKPLSVVTSQVSEYGTTLADPIQQTTNQYNLGLNYKADQTFFSLDYYASIFKNDVQSVTWNDTSDPTKTATIAGAPSNQFHQLSATGGYDISPTTRFVANASYARNTQDEAFVTAGQNAQFPLGFPGTSLHGVVVSKAVNLKLTAKPMKDLGLAVNYKFDDRDNQTPVNTYFFQDANETKSGTNAFIAGQGSNLNMYANRAYSKKVNQIDVDADYKVAKGQSVKIGADAQKIDRGCTGSWINCADAPTAKEYTLRADWKAKYSDSLDARVGYAHSRRDVNYDENAFLALVPYANAVPTLGAGAGATSSAYQYMLTNGLTGFGPNLGYAATTGQANIFTPSNNIVPQALYGSRNNINELIGMRRFNMADRNRDKLRAMVNWQANDKLSLQAGVDWANDDYSHSVFGLQSAKGGALNLEGSLQVDDSFSTSLFYTFEDRRSKAAGDAYGSNNNGLAANSFVGNAANTNVSPVACYATIGGKNANAKTDPCLAWTNEMRDQVDTLGFTFKKKGLFSPKFDLTGSIAYSRARTDISVTGGSYVNNPLAAAGAQPGGVGAYYISASNFPTVTTETWELALNGRWEIDRKSALRMRYTYAHMKAVDWMYDGQQFGTGTNYMPTNEQAPNYKVQTFGVSYLYTF
jgi:MtrB/PioB family decaheme-associated outer membrane protein